MHIGFRVAGWSLAMLISGGAATFCFARGLTSDPKNDALLILGGIVAVGSAVTFVAFVDAIFAHRRHRQIDDPLREPLRISSTSPPLSPTLRGMT